jgi:hypothetical protein
MRRTAAFAVALLTAFLFLVPVALAADPAADRGRFVMSVNGDVTVPAGDVADTVLVIDGTATIEGDVRTLVVIDGAATLTGASADEIVAIASTVTLNPGTVVTGDVQTLDSTVHKVGDAAVQGEVRGLEGSVAAMAAVIAPAFILFWLGFGLATLVAGVLLAGLAARQVRTTERLISHEPVVTLLVGLVGMIVVPALAILLMVTIVGAPLGLGLMLGAWPFLAFLGYLVAGIWIGDWLLARLSPGRVDERPYLAAVIGLLLLQLIGLVPIVSLVSAFAGLLGFGAVLLAGWRTLTARPDAAMPAGFAAPAPLPG